MAPTSTTLTNLGYLRERDAAAALPWLSIRRPLHSVTLLRTSRRWALGFAMEASGFLLYATALGLALLTLVQSIAAGEVAVLWCCTSRAVRVARRSAGTRVRGGQRRRVLLAQPDDPGTARRFVGWCHVCAALIACRLTETARARAARTAAVSVSTS